ncbi:MAG TPA: gephyrin-like molybdotransferase Glp [Nocardioides sp.]|nr:gephyrin-like molybdotransferase Glp [Nocardioides sp.]
MTEAASLEAHVARILGAIDTLPPVPTRLRDATGLVLAEDVTAAVDLPRFDHSAMDGYAVRAADLAHATPEAPVVLAVAGVLAAGGGPGPEVVAGSAVRIMTGAAVPPGADAVVPLEDVAEAGASKVSFSGPVDAGRHVRRTGGDAAAGAVVLPGRTFLGARHLGLLAAVGRPVVACHPRPRVAVISTGTELVASDSAVDALAADAVLDSNAVVVGAAARIAGADVVALGPVGDDPAAFRSVLDEALATADAVVTTGGISAGDHDVVKEALHDDPGMWFGKVAVRPGRPQGFGVLPAPDGRRVPVFALPGTPVAAYLTFVVFVRPALRELAGRRRLPALHARLTTEVLAQARTRLLPGRYDPATGDVAPDLGAGGHRQTGLVHADALLVVPPGDRLLPVGASVEVIPLDPEGR